MCHSDGSSSSRHNFRIGLSTTAAAGQVGSKPTFRERPLLRGQNSDRKQLLRRRLVLLLTATTDGPFPDVDTSVMSPLYVTFRLICFFRKGSQLSHPSSKTPCNL